MPTSMLTRALTTAALVLAATGCAADPPPPPPAPVIPAAPSVTTPAPDPRLTTRGLLPKRVGEKAGLTDPAGGPNKLEFTITAVDIDPTCPPRPQGVYAEDMRPQRGHFVRLTLDVTTGPSFNSSDMFSSVDWVDDQGITHQQVRGSWGGFLCEGDDGLTSAMGPGQRYRGVMVLDVPTTTGTLLITTSGGPPLGGGWEWQIPQT